MVDVGAATRQTEVGDLEDFVLVDEDVSSGEIPMGDADFFQMGHALGDLEGELLELGVVEDFVEGVCVVGEERRHGNVGTRTCT